MRIIAFIFFFILNHSLELKGQQSSVSGIVSIHNSKYETDTTKFVYLAQVEEEFGNSQTTTTNVDGEFDLLLVGIADKETVKLSISKEGLKVVNIDKLTAVAGQKEIIKIFMATPKYLADFRKKIYQVGRTQAEIALSQKIKAVEGELESERKKIEVNKLVINRLQEQYASLVEAHEKIDNSSKELARKYARINLDELSPILKEAFHSFQEGNLERALIILNQANLEKKTENIISERKRISGILKEVEERDSIQMKNTQEVMTAIQLKIDLHKTRFEFDSVELNYQLLLRLDSTNSFNLADIAKYYSNQNKQQESIRFFKKALTYTDDLPHRFKILVNLGAELYANLQALEAKDTLFSALAIYHELNRKPYRIRNEYLWGAVNLFNNFGVVYSGLKMSKKAEESFFESIKINKNLNDSIFEGKPMLSLALGNLGLLYRDLKDYSKSLEYHLKSLKINEQLSELYPGRMTEDLASNFAEIGAVCKELNRYEEAKDYYLKALDSLQRIYPNNPQRIEPKLVSIYNRFGSLLVDIKEFEKAEEYHLKAIEYAKRLSLNNPTRFQIYLANSHSSIAKLYIHQHLHDKAEKALFESIDIRKKLSETYPGDFEEELALGLYNLGTYFFMRQGKNKDEEQILEEKAEETYLESFQILEKLGKRVSDGRYKEEFGSLKVNLGFLYLGKFDLEKGEYYLEEGVKHFYELVEIEPAAFELDLANALLKKAMLKMLLFQQDEANRVLLKAKAIAEKYPNTPLAEAVEGFFRYLFESEWKIYNEALEQILPFQKKIGSLKSDRKKINPQENIVKAYLKYHQQFPEFKSIKRALSNAYGNLSWYQITSGLFLEAEASAREGLKVDPNEKWINSNLALSVLLQGRFEPAKEIYINFKDQEYNSYSSFKKIFLRDLVNIEKAGIENEYIDDIRALLRN